MHRIHEIRMFAIEEAAKLTKKGDYITSNEVDALRDLAKVAYCMCECEEHHNDMLDSGYTWDGERYLKKGSAHATYCTPHEEWGDADSTARELFEKLEHHYMGFWEYAAMHKKTGCDMSKQKMIDHFKGQLLAHDNIAAFVKNNCPVACPEIRTALAEWMAKK